VKLVKIKENVLINPEMVSRVTLRADYNDSAYRIMAITMRDGETYEIRHHNYGEPNIWLPFLPLIAELVA
jgi:hypothetical protein